MQGFIPGMRKLNPYAIFVMLYIMVFAIIVLRRPDILFDAQPWAEDGAVWLASNYNEGIWSSLLRPQNGYFQTVSRLAYGLGLCWGVEHAALIANLVAISLRCFFVIFLLSDRMKFIDIEYRVMASLYFLLMPNLGEGYVNITNAHWYLAMYMLAIIISEPPQSRGGKIHDGAVLLIGGLSGPFILFLAVCQAVKKIVLQGSILKAVKQIDIYDIIIACCVLLQGVAVLATGNSDRSPAPLGASVSLLAHIISFRIFGGAFLPNDAIHILGQRNLYDMPLACMLAGAVAIIFFRYGWRVRCTILFFLLILVASLAKPIMSMSVEQPQWPVFMSTGGERYFFTTNFAFFCMLLFMISRIRVGKYLSIVVFVCLVPLFASYFTIPPLVDVNYKDSIAQFNAQPAGKVVPIAINPPGWTMYLKKH